MRCSPSNGKNNTDKDKTMARSTNDANPGMGDGNNWSSGMGTPHYVGPPAKPFTKKETDKTTVNYKANNAKTMSSKKVASNSVKVIPAGSKPLTTRTSGLQGRVGSLGGFHMGGHGGAMNWENK